MPDYFEGAGISVKEIDMTGVTSKKFLRIRPYTGDAKIIFSREEGTGLVELRVFGVEVNNGKLPTEFLQEAPPVPANLQSYVLRVSCKYNEQEKQVLTARIWPKRTKVLFVGSDGRPKPRLAFVVKQEGVPDQSLTARRDGTYTIRLLAKADFEIQTGRGVRTVTVEEITPETLRNQKITVEDTIRAKFVEPDILAAAYLNDPAVSPAKKQWVNLKSGVPRHAKGCGCDAKGHLVVFTVSPDPPDSGVAGMKVYFDVNFGRESARNNPRPKLLDTDYPVQSERRTRSRATGYVELEDTAEGLRAYFEVDLGVAGGDTCEVKIGGTKDCTDANLKLVNWRKMYVQITRTAALATPSLAPAKRCLDEVNIDLEESTADEVIVSDSSCPAGSLVSGTTLRPGAPATSLVIGDHNVGSFEAKLNGRFQADSLPVAHLIFCNYQLDAKSLTYRFKKKVAKPDHAGNRPKINFPGGPPGPAVPGVKIASTTAGGDALFLEQDLTDGSDAVKRCTWREGRAGPEHDITNVDYKISGNHLYIRLPLGAIQAGDNGKDVYIRFKVAYAEGWYNGWCTGGGRHNVIVGGRPDQDICSTIVHEIGHAIFQSAKASEASRFPGLPTAPHSRFYENARGHLGPHCATGVSQTQYDSPTFRMDSAPAVAACTCIMYGSGTGARNLALAFCPNCKPYVKAVEIKQVSR